MGPRVGEQWLSRAPAIVVGVVVLTLVVTLATVVAIDVLDAFGSRDALFVRRGSEVPYAFYHLFTDGHPVEWVQWFLLALAAVGFGVAAGTLRPDGPAWGLAALGLAVGILAVHDAGNPRHVVANLAMGAGGETTATVAELVVHGFVALVALGGLAAAWPAIRHRRRARNLLLAGYGVYGIIVVMDATHQLWYVQAGTAVLDGLFGGRVLEAPATWHPGLLPWLLLDAVVEESLELVAGGLVALAALALLREATRPLPSAVPGELAGVRRRG